jgi:RNA polymerase sigma-70 factor (ECF subfamily)
MNEKPDVELLSDGRNGDSSAIGELFRRHYPYSVRIARNILHSEEDSLDAVQSAYLSAFQHFASFRQQASFNTWITRIVINKCMSYFRQPDRRLTWVRLDDTGLDRPIPHLADPTPSPEEFAANREIAAVVVNAAAGLPKGLQQAVTLRHVAGLSTKDAAGALGITVPAVKVRLFRARSRMRSPLQAVLGSVCRAG